MKKNRPKKNKSNNIDFSNIKTITDGKANLLALHLSYSMDYGVDFQNRIIKLTGVIEEGYFDFVDSCLTQMEAMNGKAITIRINSEGGYASEALAIVGRIVQSNCTIITEGYGEIMSAATIILACGDKRKMSKYATFMYHQSAYGYNGKHLDNRLEVTQAEIEEKRWASWMAEFSKKDSKYWYKIGEVKNAYFLPEECLELGIIDEII